MHRIATAYGEFLIYPGETVGEHIRAGGFWDEFLKSEFDKVQAGEVVVDVGAFIGWFSIYAAKRGCLVHAFEPSPENYEVLLENIRMNGVQGLITTHRVPLFSSETDVKIHVSGNMSSGWAVVPATPEEAVYQTRTLDSFDLKGVKLIKIDAQCCDLHIMRGARKTITTQLPVVCYEVEQSGLHLHNESLQDYHNFVEEIGYVETALMGESDFVARPFLWGHGALV